MKVIQISVITRFLHKDLETHPVDQFQIPPKMGEFLYSPCYTDIARIR